jgi:hypothetical protein
VACRITDIAKIPNFIYRHLPGISALNNVLWHGIFGSRYIHFFPFPCKNHSLLYISYLLPYKLKVNSGSLARVDGSL